VPGQLSAAVRSAGEDAPLVRDLLAVGAFPGATQRGSSIHVPRAWRLDRATDCLTVGVIGTDGEVSTLCST